MGARPRLPARLQVAAPASTQDSSKAIRASARFFGPFDEAAVLGIQEGGGDAALVEGWQQARPFRASIRGNCARRSATSRATGPRATVRVDCTSMAGRSGRQSAT